jgi:hypothetical protein
MLLPAVPIEELRRRVREAEASLRVAQQYARDAHDDPSQAAHASQRIQAICREVEELFPGMHEPSAPDPDVQEILESLAVETARARSEAGAGDGEGQDEEQEAEEAGASEDAEGAEEAEDDEAAEDDDDGDEWDIDYAKLAAAIENETLMARFPQPARETFRRAARYLIEANERRELFGRVVRGLEEVSSLAQRNVDATRRKLELALTLEQLASKHKA